MTPDAPASTTRAADLASPSPAPPDLRLGHVPLRVADLDRAMAFDGDAPGLRPVVDGRTVGGPVAFLRPVRRAERCDARDLFGQRPGAT